MLPLEEAGFGTADTPLSLQLVLLVLLRVLVLLVNPRLERQFSLFSFLLFSQLPLDSFFALLLKVGVLAGALVDGTASVRSHPGRVRIDAGGVLRCRELTEHAFHPQFFKFHLLATGVFKESVDGLVELHFGMVRQSLGSHEALQDRVIEVVHWLLSRLVDQMVEAELVCVLKVALHVLKRLLQKVALRRSCVLVMLIVAVLLVVPFLAHFLARQLLSSLHLLAGHLQRFDVRRGEAELFGTCQHLLSGLLLLQVLFKLALFFLNEAHLILQVVLFAELEGFVGQVAHRLRQVLTHETRCQTLIITRVAGYLRCRRATFSCPTGHCCSGPLGCSITIAGHRAGPGRSWLKVSRLGSSGRMASGAQQEVGLDRRHLAWIQERRILQCSGFSSHGHPDLGPWVRLANRTGSTANATASSIDIKASKLADRTSLNATYHVIGAVGSLHLFV